nr:hypothetical protein [Tanacetum cinerariifolium]
FSSTDDDSFSLDNIDYVEASPPDSELVSSEVMEIVIPEVGGIKASNDIDVVFLRTCIISKLIRAKSQSSLTELKNEDFAKIIIIDNIKAHTGKV